MGAGASIDDAQGLGPVVIGPNGVPRRMPRVTFVNVPPRGRNRRRFQTYYCHSCERSFTHNGTAQGSTGPVIERVADGNSDSEDQTVTTTENSNEAVNLLPGQVNTDADPPSTTTSGNDSNSSGTTESRNASDESDEVQCPRCGSTFVEQSRVPHHDRPSGGERGALDEHQQIQFLLSILRQNILSQLEAAELNMALRESMETYKPNITPASKGAIAQLSRYELTEETLKTAQDPMCVICSEEFKVDDVVLSLPCKHLFHAECCEKWLEINNTCCVCREPIPELKKEDNGADGDVDNDVKNSASLAHDVNIDNENNREATDNVVDAVVTSPRTTHSSSSNTMSGFSGSLNRASTTTTMTTNIASQ